MRRQLIQTDVLVWGSAAVGLAKAQGGPRLLAMDDPIQSGGAGCDVGWQQLSTQQSIDERALAALELANHRHNEGLGPGAVSDSATAGPDRLQAGRIRQLAEAPEVGRQGTHRLLVCCHRSWWYGRRNGHGLPRERRSRVRSGSCEHLQSQEGPAGPPQLKTIL